MTRLSSLGCISGCHISARPGVYFEATHGTRFQLSADGLEGLDALEGAQVLFAADSRRAHNDDSYDEVFLAYYQRIVGLLSCLLGNRARAEEVASEVFWRAYRGTLRWEDGKPTCARRPSDWEQRYSLLRRASTCLGSTAKYLVPCW